MKGNSEMAAKRMKLPKDANVGPDEAAARRLIDNGDVEGHGLPTTPPPSLISRRGSEHGGEIAGRKLISRRNDGDEGDDVEGHASRR
jgi:hypothetical protein